MAKRCVEALKDKYNAKRAFLVGSLVKGFVYERSDIDLVVSLSPELYINPHGLSATTKDEKISRIQEPVSFRLDYHVYP